MIGDTFLEKYSDHGDTVTVIDKKRTYAVTAAAKHPVYENFRVKVCDLTLRCLWVICMHAYFVMTHVFPLPTIRLLLRVGLQGTADVRIFR